MGFYGSVPVPGLIGSGFSNGASITIASLLVVTLGVFGNGFFDFFCFRVWNHFCSGSKRNFLGSYIRHFYDGFSRKLFEFGFNPVPLIVGSVQLFCFFDCRGVLSKAVIAEKVTGERFYSLFTQVVSLLIVSVILVIAAAFIEVVVFNSLLPSLV